MNRDGDRQYSDDPAVSSDAEPESLEISAAEAAEMQRQSALELENFEGGIQG